MLGTPLAVNVDEITSYLNCAIFDNKRLYRIPIYVILKKWKMYQAVFNYRNRYTETRYLELDWTG